MRQKCGSGRGAIACHYEFHVSRRARRHYQFDDALFASDGNLIFADFSAARRFAHTMNARRDVARFPERAVRAGHLNALGLIDEIAHVAIESYRQQHCPQLWKGALAALEQSLGAGAVKDTLCRFVEEFPPQTVHLGQLSAAAYLRSKARRETALQELLLLWLTNANPAAGSLTDLFDDSSLREKSAYLQMVSALHDYAAALPPALSGGIDFIAMLRAPALAHPHSPALQLRYILERWPIIAQGFAHRLLLAQDLIKEEEKEAPGGPGAAEVPHYDGGGAGRKGGAAHAGAGAGLHDLAETEQFSRDLYWMPRAVLIAKNTFVWLDQLSKKYGRAITRLDQVPGEELDALAAQGFTGLWLIGVWDRSRASRRIKQLCGDGDAHASAYSLHDYCIAAELGGEDALNDLRERAWARGLRLASDMVPNHMAIDSRWVVEHPEWFLSLPEAPFPAYSYNGEDLSHDERVGIFIEDHYYSREDAAVVFKRLDRWTGDERYIYHGNDGTSMPWNDTAQLNYLSAEVREAVICTILHVARQFPIIRFDAAMTLARRHFQRLWFPVPGSGGDIASRAEHGLSQQQFDAAMPHEFWREVVDRVAQEAPDTLLLAEAFWMMEGYFVRTLGMHRVYNSAFMNMLRDEENANYRLVIRNTLEFDPEILKRFVNFVNNPDEEPAALQFGTGDKYFGICTLMATLPGLPMFGHGQFEGLTEKYGMEFARAKWEEQPNAQVVERHQREIVPLLQRRALFAEVAAFRLYDFCPTEGGVNEDVFAFSNRHDGEVGLVVYNNRYAEAEGHIRTSVGALNKQSGELEQHSLAEGLGLQPDPQGVSFTLFRDNTGGLEYIRRSSELQARGLALHLGAYQCRVFLDFREVTDNAEGEYARIEAELGGRGTPDLAALAHQLRLQPVHAPLGLLISGTSLRNLVEAGHTRHDPDAAAPHLAALEQAEAAVAALELAVEACQGRSANHKPGRSTAAQVARATGADLWKAMQLLSPSHLATTTAVPGATLAQAAHAGLLCWLLLRHVGEQAPATVAAGAAPDAAAECRAATLFHELQWAAPLHRALLDFGLNEAEAQRAAAITRFLLGGGNALRFSDQASTNASIAVVLHDADGRAALEVNRFEEVLWFGKEAFTETVAALIAASALSQTPQPPSSPQTMLPGAKSARKKPGTASERSPLPRLERAAQRAGYRVEALLLALGN